MGWLRNGDGSLDWQDERNGQVTRRIPPERAAIIEERWAEEERQLQGQIRNRPAMGSITEEDLRKTMSQPTAYQRQMAADRAAMQAIEDRAEEGMRLGREEAARVISGRPRG